MAMPTTIESAIQRARSLADLAADAAQFGAEFAAVPRHPDIVPGQHDYGEAENRGVEEFLSDALERIRQQAGEGGHKSGAEKTRADAGRCKARAPASFW